jgi:DNA invertase Pin-like site-specific DNA recombinase
METNAIIYTRVSTQSQDYSRQIADLKTYASSNGYKVISIFSEKISGAKSNEERQALLDAVETAAKTNATILCTEFSRFGRSIQETHRMILDCIDRHINVYFEDKKLSLFTNGELTPHVMILVSVLADCAEMERQNIRSRMKSGYDHFRATGGKVGRKTGYRIEMKDYEAKYPQLVKDLRDKANGAKGSLYSVRALADRHNVNASTVQAISKKLSEEMQ